LWLKQNRLQHSPVAHNLSEDNEYKQKEWIPPCNIIFDVIQTLIDNKTSCFKKHNIAYKSYDYMPIWLITYM
jgi:hypothetical protein